MPNIGVGIGIQKNVTRRRPYVPSSDNRLTWAPPNTTLYTVQAVNSTGYQQINLAAATDYVIDMPSALKNGGLTLSGGRNIVLIGGEIQVESAPATDARRRGLYLLNQTGSIFIEGLHIHRNPSNADFDAIYIHQTVSNTNPITIQNCLLEGIKGTSAGWHGDGIQFQDTALFNGNLRLDKVTIKSDYQGFYMVHDGTNASVTFKRTNFICDTGNQGVMFWSGDNGADAWSRKNTTFLEGVYLDRTLGGTFDSEVRPNSACVVVNERPVINGVAMTWPNSAYIDGTLTEGLPPGGSYVTNAIAGHAYVSPGYIP